MSAAPASKIDGLESIRGLAAVSVVVGHFQLAFAPDVDKLAPAWAGIATYSGRAGPAMLAGFFVLSGFVLARGFLLTGRPEALAAGVVRRYPRLMLPCLAAVLLGYLPAATGAMHNHAAAATLTADGLASGWSWLDALYSFEPSLGHAVREGLWGVFFQHDLARSYDVVLWSIQPEFRGSLVMFGCLGVFARGRSLLAGGGGLLAVCVLNGWQWVGLMVAGMLLAELHRLTRRRLPAWVALPVLLAAAWLAGHVVAGKVRMPLTDFEYQRFTLTGMAAAVLAVAAVAFSPGLDRRLSVRPLVFLGRISFAVYLIHVPLLASASSFQYVALRAVGWEPTAAVWLTFAAYVPAVLLAGSLMYFAIDRPAVWFSRKLFDALRPRPEPIAPVEATVAPKMDAFDSLRGLAALMLTVAHFQSAFAPGVWPPQTAWAQIVTWPARMGHFIVALFFLLSGFVLAQAFVVTGNREILASAGARRYPRLALPCLAAVLFAYALYANGFMHNHEAAGWVANDNASQPRAELWLQSMYSHRPDLGYAFKEGLWKLFFGYDGSVSNLVNLWTMPAELRCSFLVWACLGVFGRGRLLGVGGLVIAAVFFLHGFFHLAIAVVGMLLAAVHRRVPARLPLSAALGLVAVVGWLGAHMASHTVKMPMTGFEYHHNLLFRGLAAIAAVVAVAFSPAVDWFLRLRPFVWLGRISFGLYLIHIPLMTSVFSHLYATLRSAGWSYPQTLVIVGAGYLPLCLLGGWLLHVLAERPAIWASKRFANAVLTRRPVNPPWPTGGWRWPIRGRAVR